LPLLRLPPFLAAFGKQRLGRRTLYAWRYWPGRMPRAWDAPPRAEQRKGRNGGGGRFCAPLPPAVRVSATHLTLHAHSWRITRSMDPRLWIHGSRTLSPSSLSLQAFNVALFLARRGSAVTSRGNLPVSSYIFSTKPSHDKRQALRENSTGARTRACRGRHLAANSGLAAMRLPVPPLYLRAR